MRQLSVQRNLHVVGALATLDVEIDGKKSAELYTGETETIMIDEQAHELRFVPSNLIGPRSDVVQIPPGNKNLIVFVDLKVGLIRNKLVTQLVED